MNTACVILAAGLGTRMKSTLPKVLHRVCGAPMIEHVLRTAGRLHPERVVIVTGRDGEALRDAVGAERAVFALQETPRGTAHALASARGALRGFSGVVLVMNGDTPLLSSSTIRRFARLHAKGRAAVSVLTFRAADPTGYGRIIRDSGGPVAAIVEEKDASAAERTIAEVNSGVYAINHKALGLLDRIRMNPIKKEYYLTDIVAAAAAAGMGTAAHCIGTEEEFMGVNTRQELQRAGEIMRRAIVAGWNSRGVTFVAPDSVFIHPDAVLGRDTVVYPNVHIEGATRIGAGTVIYPNVRVSDSIVGSGVTLKDSTVIEGSRIRDGASVGPFAHLRTGSDIGPEAKVGNFVEIKKSRLGRGVKASHLSYLGDAVIGNASNVGAGTITCNYDGEKKHRTVIQDHCFIGSDTQLVAPVTVGRGAYVGAGSTITKDVPAGALAISRTPQKNLSDWAARKRRKPAKGGRKGR